MKISYLFPTIKPKEYGLQIIEDIKRLPSHDYEIILVSPDESWAENPDIKYVKENKKEGTVKATNLAYKNCSGDFVICQTDDHRFSSNFLDFIKSALSEEVSKTKIRVGNACVIFGRYGSRCYYKPTKTLETQIHPTSLVVPETIPCKPYSIVCFPMIFKEDVERYMDGVIFNESFNSFYADSWMGMFVENQNQKEVDWPKDVWVDVQQNNFAHVANRDKQAKDHSTFLKLIKKFNENPDISYNLIVD